MIEVFEIGLKIPKTEFFHINPNKSFCLGSPFRLKMLLSNDSSLNNFVEKCLIPYLYAISLKLKYNINLVFGELAHGNAGLYDDYKDILGLETDKQVQKAFDLLSMKKRVSNKKKCPCGCEQRLGKCFFRFKIHNIRKQIPTSWFKKNKL